MNAEYREVITRTMEYGGILECQAAPSLEINRTLYTDLTPEKVTALLKGGLGK